MWYWNVKKNLEVISLIGIDNNDNEPATLWLAIRDRAAVGSVLRWIRAPTSTFLIILQCGFPCTGYEYKDKMIRYTKGTKYELYQINSGERIESAALKKAITTQWAIQRPWGGFEEFLWQIPTRTPDGWYWCLLMCIMMTMMRVLTYSWLSRVLTALKEEYAGQSVPRNSQDCK